MAETPLYIQKSAKTDSERLDNVEALLRLLLLSAGPNMPVTQIAGALPGATIGTTSQYVELYKNNYKRLLAVKIAADFNIVAQSISISITTDQNDYGQVDVLSQGGKIVSDTIWLRPDQTLYVNTLNTAVTLNGARFRILSFDPLSFAGFMSSGI